jgi:hypothetical protein
MERMKRSGDFSSIDPYKTEKILKKTKEVEEKTNIVPSSSIP